MAGPCLHPCAAPLQQLLPASLAVRVKAVLAPSTGQGPGRLRQDYRASEGADCAFGHVRCCSRGTRNIKTKALEMIGELNCVTLMLMPGALALTRTQTDQNLGFFST